MKKTNKIKKYLSIILITLILETRVLSFSALAEEIPTPIPTPEPTNSTQIDNSSTTNNSVDSLSDTGNNGVESSSSTPQETPTPTPNPTVAPENTDPTPTPTPLPDSTITAVNSADVTNFTDSTAITGENSITTADSEGSPQVDSTSSPQVESVGDLIIQTGDAISSATVENSVNTTNINSEVINQTINLFVAENGNLDLSDPFTIVNDVITEHSTDPVINVSVVSVNNYSYLSNDIVSFANTGNNQINNDGTAIIKTGNAYSMVSLLNQVNFTIVDSQIHLLTINIFGDLNGNIILPDSTNQSTDCDGCGINLAINNQATLENNTDSTAISGQNSIIASESGEITTGDAKSSVSNINIVNTNLAGVNMQALYINNLGNWDGNFVGWGSFDPRNGGTNLVLYNLSPNGQISCPSCVGSLIITNDATVSNSISSTANTGGNSINGENGTIHTGRAFSAASIFNFINSSFINSIGFFGFINIFGDWKGDIGGKSNFAVIEEPVIDEEVVEVVVSNENPSDNTNTSPLREQGGLLSVTQSNNVGEYVLPGDTVTFFVNVKNIGSGRVYDAKLDLFLVKNDKNVGGATFNLGDIGIGKETKVSTGLVLSTSVPFGAYIARAIVKGTVGPENSEITASSDSFFDVFGSSNFATAATGTNPGVSSKPTVLGSTHKGQKEQRDETRLIYLLIFTVLGYTGIRVLRGRKNLARVFTRGTSLQLRIQALRMFLL